MDRKRIMLAVAELFVVWNRYKPIFTRWETVGKSVITVVTLEL